MLIGRRSSGLSVGYQAAGNICTIQLIDTDYPYNSYALVNKSPFCLHYSNWSPNQRYAAVTAYPSGSLSIATGRNGNGWKTLFDVEQVNTTSTSSAWSLDSQQLAFLINDTGSTIIGTVRMKNDIPEKPRFFTLESTQPVLYTPPAWSPDGQFIAFGAYASSLLPLLQGSQELYILNVNSGEVRRLTNNHYRDDSPSWSPDGSQLVFTSSKNGYNELYIIDVATGERRQLTYSTFGYLPSWSPDGKNILFMSNMDHNNDLYVIGANGRGIHRLTHNHYTDSVFPIWLFPQ